VKLAIPPSSHRVIDSISYPYRMATIEWPNSWRRTPPNSPSAAANPSAHGVSPAPSAAGSMPALNASFITSAIIPTCEPMR